MTAPQHALERTVPAWMIWVGILVAAGVMLWALTLLRHAGADCVVTVNRTGVRWAGADPRTVTSWPPPCTLRWGPERGDR